MKEKTIKFTGKPSGDYESFVWDVIKEDFIRILGREPDEDDQAEVTEGRYMIYPNNLLKGFDEQDKDFEFEITIKCL
ncbi:hypothetical protein [Paenibacillus sp. 1781tsa1]|uniref:hypothetical protein n=1 Tax=Paenibacillus sp. 1781tsa1 TaxID=2953810 RepID=UPI00209D8325|nr:hypothetical protein [Paenibacillus sp. 1781tsa1]MCP1184915.1 hypothetical protein [Paenibacillus sp. 1781tsa1]